MGASDSVMWENEIGVDIFWGCDRICSIANNSIANSLVSEQFDGGQFMCKVVRCEAV